MARILSVFLVAYVLPPLLLLCCPCVALVLPLHLPTRPQSSIWVCCLCVALSSPLLPMCYLLFCLCVALPVLHMLCCLCFLPLRCPCAAPVLPLRSPTRQQIVHLGVLYLCSSAMLHLLFRLCFVLVLPLCCSCCRCVAPVWHCRPALPSAGCVAQRSVANPLSSGRWFCQSQHPPGVRKQAIGLKGKSAISPW